MMYGMKVKSDNTQKNFPALIQRGRQCNTFIYLKLFEQDEQRKELAGPDNKKEDDSKKQEQ